MFFFFSSRRRHTRLQGDWSSDVCSSDLAQLDDGANGSYNGLLVSVNRRLSRNFSMLLNYTWAHCISDGDASSEIGGGYQNPKSRRDERGNCVVDVQIGRASCRERV